MPVPAADVWFWYERWNVGEREVDDHVRSGEIDVHESVDELEARTNPRRFADMASTAVRSGYRRRTAISR
ncbi:MAG: hypothetical protein H0V64_14630 [Geodermatophilaceae bacterium]|nr:hypothetical protein [Geodermatophilaceae bacterium]MDQ3463353.1 hypothetical protein [Actinomycetota bacterium]